MNITVFGVGYVGLTAGVCFSEMGNNVLCMDIDKQKVELLKGGNIPIYEPALKEMLNKNAKDGRLNFTSSLKEALEFSSIIFVCLGTPSSDDGNLNLNYINGLIEEISKNSEDSKYIIIKSTVPPGTCLALQSYLDNSDNQNDFKVVSNPEFMKEGDAVNDFLKPERIIIGTTNKEAISILRELYEPFNRNTSRVMEMDSTSSELTKYASNAMLATRISFMNELSQLCENIGADIELIREGMASDSRIGGKFLYPGIGYGGSCFPKDIKGLINLFSQNGIESEIVNGVHTVNEKQKKIIVNKLEKFYENQDLGNKNISILGLSFKPETDDLREAPSLSIYESLKDKVNKIRAYDPLAKNNIEYFKSINLDIKEDVYSCCAGSDAIIICTEWKEFRSMDLERLAKIVNEKVIFDGRNLFDPLKLEKLGWEYISIGRKYNYG